MVGWSSGSSSGLWTPKRVFFQSENSMIEESEKWFFRRSSARRGASDLKPPPIDVSLFMLIFVVI